MSVKEIVWRELGACRGLEAAMFYPDDDDLALEAKAVCAGCDVRIACLEHALQATGEVGNLGWSDRARAAADDSPASPHRIT